MRKTVLNGTSGPTKTASKIPAAVKTPVLGQLKSCKCGGKMAKFGQEMERLCKVSQAAASQQPLRLTDFLMVQVEVLQDAFMTLADAMVSELDDVRREASAWRKEREEWLSAVRSVRQDANDKLLEVERSQAAVAVQVGAALVQARGLCEEAAVRSGRQVEALTTDVRAARVEVQVLRNAVKELQTLTAEDFPNEVVRARMADAAYVESQVSAAIAGVVPSMVATVVRQEAPGAVREEVGAMVREAVDERVEMVKSDLNRVAERVCGEVGVLGGEVAEVTGVVATLGTRTKALESSLARVEHRMVGVEGVVGVGAGGGLAQAVAERLDEVAASHARYAASMEEVVRAVVDDAGALAGRVARHDAALGGLRSSLSEARQAVGRCATVFSQLLGVPPPVPVGSFMGQEEAGQVGGLWAPDSPSLTYLQATPL